MRHLRIPLRMVISPALVLAMLVFASSGSAGIVPQTTAPEDKTDETAGEGLTTTVITITAPDGSESVYTDQHPIQNTTLPTNPTAAICEGPWRGTSETEFALVSQTRMDTFTIAFRNIGGCLKVTVKKFPVMFSGNSFTISYDFTNVSAGSLTGTFSSGRDNVSGTFTYTSLQCGGIKSGTWIATPAVHCAPGPDIDVTPSSFAFSVEEGGSDTELMTITNAAAPGSRDLFWYAANQEPTLQMSDGRTLPVSLQKVRRVDNSHNTVGSVKNEEPGLDPNGDIVGATNGNIYPDAAGTYAGSVEGLGDVVHSFSSAVSGFFGLEWVDGFIWATCHYDKILNKLDPIHGTVLDQIAVPEASRTTGLAWDGSAFWITDAGADVINKVDLSGAILMTFDAPSSGSVGLACDGAYLWDVDWVSDELHKIDPADGSVLLTLPAPDSRPAGTAWDGQHIWINGRSNATTYKIDPSDGAVIDSFATPPGPGANNGHGTAFDGQYLWIVNSDVQQLYQIDIEKKGGYVWLSEDPSSGTLSAGGSDVAVLTVDASGLPRGSYNGNLMIYSDDPDENPAIIPITLDVGVVAVDDEPAIPKQFALSQNYPNPFNPSTAIEFALPHSGFVTLRVYNVLGEEVATLVAGDHPAGTFNAIWDASDMPSGVYFYRLTAGEYVQTKKAVLMR
ncbi:MAG: T9SS type A sorting domain-containing protein [Bacteroidota bacterium]